MQLLHYDFDDVMNNDLMYLCFAAQNDNEILAYLKNVSEFFDSPDEYEYINTKNARGNTALHYACANPNLSATVISKLLEYKAGIRANNIDNLTSALICLLFCDIQKLQALFEKDPTLPDQRFPITFKPPDDRSSVRIPDTTLAQLSQHQLFEEFVKKIPLDKTK